MNGTNMKLAASKDNSIHRYIFGDGGVNTLTGGGVSDHLYGGSGDDTLDGAGGDDYLEGGQGDDTYQIGSGKDTIFDSDKAGQIKLGEAILNGSGNTAQVTMANLGPSVWKDAVDTSPISSIQFSNGQTMSVADAIAAVGIDLPTGASLEHSIKKVGVGGMAANDGTWRCVA